MELSIVGDGLLDPRKLQAWTQQQQDRIFQAVGGGMNAAGKVIADKANADARRVLTIAKKTFPNFFRRVYQQRKDILPQMLVASRVLWIGIHERGGTIQGPLLVPLLEEGKRIGPKAFRLLLKQLDSQGNLWADRVDGRTILFTEKIGGKEQVRGTRRFERAERQRTGAKTIKRGAAVPIAIVIPRARMRKRLQFERIVRSNTGLIVREIQQRLNKGR